VNYMPTPQCIGDSVDVGNFLLCVAPLLGLAYFTHHANDSGVPEGLG